MKNDNLQRFIDAHAPIYQTVESELKNANKTSHWMWFIFPKLKGLGLSSKSQFYGIADRDEAIAYLNHPILGKRLLECCQILLSYHDKSAEQIFGGIDSVKLKSSMTLFDKVYGVANNHTINNVFESVLNQYFNGGKDLKTLELLESKINV